MLRPVPLAVLLVLLAHAAPAFAQGSAAPATPPPAAAALPVDTKIAFVNLPLVFNQSAIAKDGQERRRLLNEKLFAGLTAREKEIEGLRAKIKSQQGVVERAVLRAWTGELQRLEREAQFAEQEAEIQSNQLWADVLAAFEERLVPIVDALRVEKGLHAIFGIQSESSGVSLLAADRGLDLSAEVVRRLNEK